MTVSGLDPANTSVGVVLSSVNSLNDTATWVSNPNNTQYGVSRSLGFQNSGQVTLGFTVNVGVGGGAGISVGIGTQNMPTDGSQCPGVSGDTEGPTSIAWFNDQSTSAYGGQVFMNGTNPDYNTIWYGYPNSCAIALDFDLGLFWIKNLSTGAGWGNANFENINVNTTACQNGPWEPPVIPGVSVSGTVQGNPTTSYGGTSFSQILADYANRPGETPEFFACIGFHYVTQSVTINWSGTPLSGFLPWTPTVPPTGPVSPPGFAGTPLAETPPGQWPGFEEPIPQLPAILYR
jgi:hypothetical protein